ncbi:hypothetical protein VCB98_05990 [Gammaproteobacteria bacterium AB-CW1]|uniref:Uncharacterized protein n=1 Tax=Natronospira elongata TaxID=3110268 RepID=A0AAP6MJU6_9GAMM|nr:hypothetical protein [Gammaproteobacteria bacterium AB-CW1]
MSHPSGPLAALALSLFGLSGPLLAATPEGDWRSLETDGFRLHFEAEAEPWARRAAARLEAVADEVHERVGHAPAGPVDVLIADPLNSAAGMAIPLTGRSRMVLFTTPPLSDELLGHYSDWPELLIIHEHVHLAHLSRPLRTTAGERMNRWWLPFDTAHLAEVPLWVIEGYATYLEGQLTGTGRPNSDWSASRIRAWALAGELPGYGALSRRPVAGWNDSNQVYLVGAAFFQWLEDREGEQAFRDLWARMTSSNRRSFSENFRGVFGESPARLYHRFTAEVTRRALEVEEQLPAAEDALWQRFSGSLGHPAVSPEGDYLALVRSKSNGKPALHVYALDDNESAFEDWQRRQEEQLERDPDDVAAVEPESLPRESKHRLVLPNNLRPRDPRWLPDGEGLLFTAATPDGQGRLIHELYRWHLSTGEVEQLTRQAHLRRPEPAPSGDWAVAVRLRNGHSQLVRVALDSGDISPLGEARLDQVHDFPRLSPDGSRLVYLRHQQGRWTLMERMMPGGESRELLQAEAGGYLSRPAFTPDGEYLYYARGYRGLIGIERLAIDSDERQWRRLGAKVATSPLPVPGREALLYLEVDAHEPKLRWLDSEAPPPLPELALHAPVTLTPQSLQRRAPPAVEAVESRDYGLGPQFASAMLNLRWDRNDTGFDLGVKGGDLVGRVDWLAALSASTRGSREGAVLAAHYAGWPATLRGALFHQADDPAALREIRYQQAELVQAQEQTGFLLSSRLGRGGQSLAGSAEAGLAMTRAKQDGDRFDRDWAWLTAGGRWYPRRENWRMDLRVNGSYYEGSSDGQDWDLSGLHASLAVGQAEGLLELAWQRRSLSAEVESLQLGGLVSTSHQPRSLPLRIFEPALPLGLSNGREYQGQTLQFRDRRDTRRLFHRRHRLGESSASEGDWLEITGLEFSFGMPSGLMALPEIRNARLEFGLARIQGDPLRFRNRAWINMRYDW